MTNVHAARTIACVPMGAPVARAGATPPPASSWEPAVLDVARDTLGDARVKLAGTISERDNRYLLELRRSLRTVAAQLRQAAALGMFPFELRSGAADALRASQLLGRASAITHEVHGEPTREELRRIEARLDRVLRSAKFSVDQAFIAAHTGTHP